MIIALSGYAGAGKDSVAAVLADHGYQRLAFADPLKAVLHDLDPQLDSPHWTLAQLVDRQGWDTAKRRPEVRGLLQRLGAACRTHIGANVWVDALMARIDTDRDGMWCITDCRYPNEAVAVITRGGHVWRVDRPGTGPVNGHPSETALDGGAFDRIIRNDGNLNQLRHRVEAALHATVENGAA